ncbi:MAG TPA: helix-turn-helix domain-containing protein [Allosphingosinicella sp.]|nr:helix-turn-helix domain-containing protein [Allosphingosinicella sp.]
MTSTEPRRPAPLDPISVRIPEAVRLTGLSRSRLYELIGSGEIEFVKVGASTLVLVESLRAFIDRKRRSTSRVS